MQFSRIPIAHRHFYICICLISKSRPICIVVSIVRNTNIQLLWLQPNHWRCSRVTGCHEWETICCRYCCCCCFCCVRKKPVYISIHAKQCRWMWLGYEVWLGERGGERRVQSMEMIWFVCLCCACDGILNVEKMLRFLCRTVMDAEICATKRKRDGYSYRSWQKYGAIDICIWDCIPTQA